MQCLTPILLRKERVLSSQFQYNKVPCGKCVNCRKRRLRDWIFRLERHAEYSESAAFLTLTYDDEHLPYGDGIPTLNRKDLTDFWKRLRKHQDTPLKYYACGEYGDLTGRPHYHAILFDCVNATGSKSPGINFVQERLMKKIWTHGNVRIDHVSSASIAYVVGYTDKKYLRPDVDYTGREKEFTVSSKGLGLPWLTDAMVEYLRSMQELTVYTPGGVKRSIPRYYRNKVWNKKELERLSAELLKKIPDLDEKTRRDLVILQDRMYRKKLKEKLVNKTF